ncbi:MAG TPA: hypothetical protein VIW80_15890 [Pyrinomonadaceae bacterium]|jgi:hypothetical protein
MKISTKKSVRRYTLPVALGLATVVCYMSVPPVAAGGIAASGVPYLLALLAGVSTLWSP